MSSAKIQTREAAPRQQQLTRHDEDLQPFTDLVHYARDYAREKPEVVAMVCFGVGFFVGWKLKPW